MTDGDKDSIFQKIFPKREKTKSQLIGLLIIVIIVDLVDLMSRDRNIFSLYNFIYLICIIAVSYFIYKKYGQPGYVERNDWKNVNKTRFWILFTIGVIMLLLLIYML